MNTDMKPYEGTRPYLFVSYAHKDREQVLPLLEAMYQAGYRFWYDRGIPWSEEWADMIADYVENCAACIAFHSEASKKSRNCREELYYALGEEKPVFSVYLDAVSLSRGLKMRLAPYQGMKLAPEDSPEAFVERLDRAAGLAVCKAPGWNKVGQIQWRVNEENVLTVRKSEDFDGAAGSIPDYQADYVRGGSTAPWMLYRNQIAAVVIGDDIASVGAFAFRDCKNLAGVAIPDSVTAIGESAFANCRNLTAVSLPDSVSSMGKFAFEQCSALASLSLSDSVSVIEASAFASCVSLTEVTLPDSVTAIRAGAFVNCKNLADIVIPDSVASIEMGAFLGCERLSFVEVPETAVVHPHAFDARTSVIRRTVRMSA